LKWRALDRLELALLVLCGALLAGFTVTVAVDILSRTAGRPVLWIQEVTSIQFIYCVFLGTAVAVRRNDHLLLTEITEALTGRLRFCVETGTRLVILGVAICLIWFGYQNVLTGLASFRMPSLHPLAYWYAAIPLSGALIALFAIEQLVNGWRNGYERAVHGDAPPGAGT